jgi:hypothetical protein
VETDPLKKSGFHATNSHQGFNLRDDQPILSSGHQSRDHINLWDNSHTGSLSNSDFYSDMKES